MHPTMLVATHKASPVPHDDFYLPVHVGHARSPLSLNAQSDAEGDNISLLNDRYCELTAFYWAWKNLDSRGLGLSHYRRYFRGSQRGPSQAQILSRSEAHELLESFDIIIAKPRNYVIESVESHYRHAHVGSDLDVARDVVLKTTPHMHRAWGSIMGGRRLSLYNMFLARSSVVDDYASWLFHILEDIDQTIDVSERSATQSRAIGYLAERLLNVWVEANSSLSVHNLQVVNVEGEPLAIKALGLIRRKLNAY